MAFCKEALTDEQMGNIKSAANTYLIQLSKNPTTSLRAEFLRRLTDFILSKKFTVTEQDLDVINTIVTTTTAESRLSNAVSKVIFLMASRLLGLLYSQFGNPEAFLTYQKVIEVRRQAVGMMLLGAEYRERVYQLAAANGIREGEVIEFERPIRALDLNATQVKYFTDRIKKVEGRECYQFKAVESDDVKLKKCSQCQRIWLCSKDCQKKALKTHKKSCREVKRLEVWRCGNVEGTF
ncbi:hypothetical protein HDU76_013998 [Blyttiomyces sp. JEL0837]|nr:hypothetical protein HDU76_013998 [Blyttiomyces sp. JEL0837]